MSNRRRIEIKDHGFYPAYVVWELTLKCDHLCHHCGSRAGRARDEELDLEQALSVVDQMAAMGTREVVLIGGEAYLYEHHLAVIRALRAHDINVCITTGGRGITRERAQALADAGVRLVSVSIDGLEAEHDQVRNSQGSFQSTMRALDNLRVAGIKTGSNININRINQHCLEDLYEHLKGKGIDVWQVQITSALGRAADRPEMLLQPYDLLTVMPRIAALKERAIQDGISMMPGNNLGYFGPEEKLLRSLKKDHQDHWAGCQAGRFVMGIESDGGVKGCPSLQSDSYIGGHVTERPLREIWDQTERLAFARFRTREDLWGHCAECVFADTCLGGCSFTAHALFGRPGNNPYCHFRAQQFDKRGLRERLVRTEAAPGLPFDHAKFEIVVEEVPATDRAASAPRRLKVVA